MNKLKVSFDIAKDNGLTLYDFCKITIKLRNDGYVESGYYLESDTSLDTYIEFECKNKCINIKPYGFFSYGLSPEESLRTYNEIMNLIKETK